MSTITVNEEIKNRLDEITRNLNISKEEVLETALSIFESTFKEKKEKDSEFALATEIMKKTSKELRRLNPQMAKRAKIIEGAKIDVSEVISPKWGIEI